MTLLTHVNKHVDSLLATLDVRLNDFQHVLPRLDPSRGLLEIDGLVNSVQYAILGKLRIK